MWEVVTLNSLAQQGTLLHEVPLDSGRKPDIRFKSDRIAFTADITTVSDEGLHENNPVELLSDLLHKELARLGLSPGGLDLRIASKQRQTRNGVTTELCLPHRSQLTGLVRKQIGPRLREQLENGSGILRISIENDSTSLQVTVNPSKSPFSTTSHASYNAPTIKDRNPLYGALRAKAKQLRGAPGLVGIIVGDSATQTLHKSSAGFSQLQGREIAAEFLRQHSSIGFVLLVTVREEQTTFPQSTASEKRLDADLICSRGIEVQRELRTIFANMLAAFPKPVRTPINASNQAKRKGFGLGHHGGFTMSGNRIKVSAREVLEILSGRSTVEEVNRLSDQIGLGDSINVNSLPRLIEYYLSRGMLPTSISIIKTDENDNDDWIEFEFGPPDPAITPFQ